MLEAVENQSPEYVIVDEISSREQSQAARTINGRGVTVIATVHGDSITDILQDPERSLLLGSLTSVTLSRQVRAAFTFRPLLWCSCELTMWWLRKIHVACWCGGSC